MPSPLAFPLAPALDRLPFDDQLLDLGDCLGRIQALRTGVRTRHDRMAAVELERVFEVVEARAGVLVARVGDPAIGLQQDRRTEVAIRVPPVTRAGRRAAGAQDALVETVEFRP